MSALPTLKNRLGVQLLFDGARTVVVIASFWAPAVAGLGANAAVGIFSALTVCVNAACLLVYWRMARSCPAEVEAADEESLITGVALVPAGSPDRPDAAMDEQIK